MTELAIDIDRDILTGQAEHHLLPLQCHGASLHAEVVPVLELLQQLARERCFELAVASGYRSFDRQLAIWNAKASGQRPVLDDAGQAIDLSTLDPLQQVHAIMRWSALPGASRHHWGTDFDFWDPSAVAADYQLQLLPEEYRGDGPFAPLSQWLATELAAGDWGFCLPYAEDCGGVAPEPWHLSFQPISASFAEALTPALLIEVLAASELLLKETVLANIEPLFERYIRVP